MKICSTRKWKDSLILIKEQIEHNIDLEYDVIQLADLEIKQFADGELLPVFNETVRDEHVVIIGSTEQPHDNIFEVLLIADAARRSSAKKITLINCVYGYARQDRRDGVRCSHGSKMMANMLQNSGINHIITFDIHALQIDGNFDIPFDNITSDKFLYDSLFNEVQYKVENNLVLCSPDAGGVKRVELMNHKFDDKLEIATILKKRTEANKVDSMQLIGDVKGKFVVIIDDMLDTGGTLCKAVDYLLSEGATGVGACITHAVMSKTCTVNIAKSNLDFLILSNTYQTINSNMEYIDNLQNIHTEFKKTKLIIADINFTISNLIVNLYKGRSLNK